MRWTVLTSCCVLALGCGEPVGPDGGMGGGGAGGGSAFDPDLPGINGLGGFLTEAERIAVVDAAKKVQAATVGTWEQQDDAMVAQLRKDPKIEAAGVSRLGNVWGRFIDGTMYMDLSRTDLDIAGVRRLTGAPRMHDLPVTSTAVSANSLEPFWPDTSATIAGWLGGYGYTVRPGRKLTHYDLQALRDVGAFFWQTHSAEGDLRPVKKDATGKPLVDPATGRQIHFQAFAFQTDTTLASGGTMPLSADDEDLRNRNLLTLSTVSLVLGQLNPYEYRFGITNAFIEQRMAKAFAANSLVAIDSCTGVDGVPGFQKTRVGTYVAWDKLSGVRSPEQHLRLFDRLLGQNAPPASTPLERPFDVVAVKSWMQKKKYDLDPSPDTDGGVNATPAKLTFFQFGQFDVLRPTITRLLFRSSNAPKPFEKIVVEGTFGEDPGAKGTVRWGTTNLTVAAWTPTEIEVRVPPPPYPTGPLFVKVDERESQGARLTVWNIPLTYTLTGRGSLQAVATMNCVLRSDVRGTRFEPEEVPQVHGLVNGSYLLDSSGSITATGTASNPTETWSGGQSLTLSPQDGTAGPSSNYCSCFGTFDGTTKKLTLQVVVNASFAKNALATGGIINSQFAYPPTGIVIDTDWPTRTLLGKTVPGNWPIPNETLSLSFPNVVPTAGTAPTDQDAR